MVNMDNKIPHRFYESEFPEVGDVIVVIATEMTEMGAYVNLPEYPELNGMIQLGELSQKRVRSLNKVIRIGQTDTAMVSKVDPDKKTVDLSRRRLRPQDTTTAMDKYIQAKSIGLIVRNLALKTIASKHGLLDISKLTQFDEVNLLQTELYEELVWPLYVRYGHAYKAFVSVALGDLVCPSTTTFPGERIAEEICARIKPEPMRIYADVQIVCAGMDGLLDLRRVMQTLLSSGRVQIHLLAPPLYRISTETLRHDDGIKTIKECLDAMKTMIDGIPGAAYFVVKEPTAMTKSDDIMAIPTEPAEDEAGDEE